MTTSAIPTTLSDLSGNYVIDPAHTRIGFVARHELPNRVNRLIDFVAAVAVIDDDHPLSRVDLVEGRLQLRRIGVGRINDTLEEDVRPADLALGQAVAERVVLRRGDRKPGERHVERAGRLPRLRVVRGAGHRCRAERE